MITFSNTTRKKAQCIENGLVSYRPIRAHCISVVVTNLGLYKMFRFHISFKASGIFILLLSLMIINTHAHAFQAKQGDAFERANEKGVTVWRGVGTKRINQKRNSQNNSLPALLGGEPLPAKAKTKTKTSPRSRTSKSGTAKVRVIGHFSGYGERIPFVQGFYSGYPRSKNSRSFVQGFYSGQKSNSKRRFPLERPDGRRRFR